jgi:hypothetical protein
MFNFILGFFYSTVIRIGEFRVMVFYATFNNILVILWRLVLLVEKIRVPGENRDLSKATDEVYHIMLCRVQK